MLGIQNKSIVYLMIVIFIIKSVLVIGWGNFTTMNPDEERNYQIASNYVEGKGYTIKGKPSAYHGSTSVFVYQFLIEQNISKKVYIAFYQILLLLLFVASIPFFNSLLISVGVSQKISFYTSIFYCLFPTNLLFVGFFLYEKIALPLLVISFTLLYQLIVENKKGGLVYVIPFTVSLSILFRANLFFIYFMSFAFFTLFILLNAKKVKHIKSFIILSALTIFLLALAHIPILEKNNQMFGNRIISTQMGYELMQGHNDLTNGFWMPGWRIPGYPYHTYSHEAIPNINELNEYEESLARKDFALNWILENQKKEMRLIVKKSLLFVVPKVPGMGFNVPYIILNLLLFLGVFLLPFTRQLNRESWLYLAPILGAFIFSLIFYTEVRVRYYIEPFLMVLAAAQLSVLLKKGGIHFPSSIKKYL